LCSEYWPVLIHRLYCVVTFGGTFVNLLAWYSVHIKQNQMIFDSIFIAQKDMQTKMIVFDKTE